MVERDNYLNGLATLGRRAVREEKEARQPRAINIHPPWGWRARRMRKAPKQCKGMSSLIEDDDEDTDEWMVE